MSDPASVNVTDRAFSRIARVLDGEPPGAVLRLAVNGGGCSGFQYVFDIDRKVEPDDVVIDNGKAKVVIDETSLQLLGGSTIDFVDDLIGQSFRVTNPNATASCGCGTSFAI